MLYHIMFHKYALVMVAFMLVHVHTKEQRYSCGRSGLFRKAKNYLAWSEQKLICLLVTRHSHRVRPSGHQTTNGSLRLPTAASRYINKDIHAAPPVQVFTSVSVQSINSVSAARMEFTVQMRFQQVWWDGSHLQITLAEDQRVWQPDTFFQNERDGHYHNIDRENMFVRIRSDDAYTTEDLFYVWAQDAVYMMPGATECMPNFRILKLYNNTCTSNTTTGRYSCEQVVLILGRVFSYFLIQLYVPTGMLVAVSWVSYWIDFKATAARVPLAIVTLLTMIATSQMNNANLPPVSYTKAIDVWIGACVMFVFGALIEYAAVNYVAAMNERKRQEKASQQEAKYSSMPFPVPSMEVRRRRSGVAERPRMRSPRPFERIESDPLLTPHMIRRDLQTRRRRRVPANDAQSPPNIVNKLLAPQVDKLKFWRTDNGDWRETPELVPLPDPVNALVRECLLIDMVARAVVPVAFGAFNAAYWGYYLKQDDSLQ